MACILSRFLGCLRDAGAQKWQRAYHSTWPAFWTSTPNNWPQGGEIDIIEGVDGEGANLASLHTGGACQVPSNVSTVQQGYVAYFCSPSSLQQPNCTNQPGCATKFDNVASFGLGFNAKYVLDAF